MSVYHIGIVDYGMGNLYSVRQAIQTVAPQNTHIHLCQTPEQLKAMDRIVLPGQGAMPEAMQALHRADLYECLREVLQKKPVLAICVGHQMLLEQSGEGNVNCLHHIQGDVVRLEGSAFEGKDRLKVPHMGWSRVWFTQDHPVWKSIPSGSAFYFVHSYYAQPKNTSVIAAQTHYGITFCSAMATENIFSVQFHPEKSAEVGLKIYQNFNSWNP